jgi:transposase
MPRPYSDDLRERVIEAVEAGASRREAAESFNLCPSSAVKWLQRWRDTGSAKAKPTGGSTSPLEEHAEELLALIAEQPDLSLDEVVVAMRKRRIRGSRTAAWRFFARHGFTFKKSCVPRNNNGRTWPAHADAREQFMFDPARLAGTVSTWRVGSVENQTAVRASAKT